MPLRLYSHVHAEFPDLTPSWSSGDDSIVFSHPRFGSIFHVAICDEAGKPIYDQPIWSEPIGAVIVPVDENSNIAFIENYRAISPSDGKCGSHPPSASDLAQRGKFSLELPRGFGDPGESSEETARRETQEETGCKVTDIIYLGQSNSNTTFFINNSPVWLAYVTRSHEAQDKPDKYENIRNVRFMELQEAIRCVRLGDIICGVTKSALLHYLAWLQSKCD